MSVEDVSLPVAATSNQRAADGDWDFLEKALISSLICGTFLDSHFMR